MIAVLLPAFDEAPALPALLHALAATLGPTGTPWRVLLVDDGSTDGTADAARACAPPVPLAVARHPCNLGVGAALRTGLAALLATLDDDDVIVTMDADGTHSPATIPALLAALDAGADVAVGSRFVPGGGEVGVPAHRRALSRAARAVLGRLGPAPVLDWTSGFRALRAGAVRRAATGARPVPTSSPGFPATAELLLELALAGARIVEVPTVVRYDMKHGPSSLRVPRALVGYARMLARLAPPLMAARRAR